MTVIEKARQLRKIIESLAVNLDDTEALESKELFPSWTEEMEYVVDDRVRYEDKLYKCLQSHTSQSTWTPTNAPSLWAEVLIPDPTVIPEWVQPDSTNPYMTGDKVTHNGFIWESLVDNNVWEPSDAVPTLWNKGDST